MKTVNARAWRVVATAVLAVASSSLALIGGAGATSPPVFVVGSNPVGAPGTTCYHPNFSTIQSAINAAESVGGGIVRVCYGIYHEQIQITGSHRISISAVNPGSGTTIALPSTPVNSTTPCDTAPGTGSFTPDQDLIAICGTSPATVLMTSITLRAQWPTGTCSDSLYGVLVGGGDTFIMSDVKIIGAGPKTLNGCSHGVALQVGMGWTTPVEVGHAILLSDRFVNYESAGVMADGAGSTVQMRTSTVTGAGVTAATAQDGVVITHGAQGFIKQNVVTHNECNATGCGANALTQTQAAGVDLAGAAAGTKVLQNRIQFNDVGVRYKSGAVSLPTTSDVVISLNGIGGDRYENLLVDQGRVTTSFDLISGSAVGIMVIQYVGQSYGPHVSAGYDTVLGATSHALQIVSDLGGAGDHAGSVVLNKCHLHGTTSSNALNIPITVHS